MLQFVNSLLAQADPKCLSPRERALWNYRAALLADWPVERRWRFLRSLR